jgi:hypothetical protein
MIKEKVNPSSSGLTVGGTFVLYMLLSRYLNLDRHTPGQIAQHSDSLLLTVAETIDSTSDLTGRPIKGAWIKEYKLFRIFLLLWALFGASCVMADGLLTPAVSVISAVAGILALLPSSSQGSLFQHPASTVPSSRSPLPSLSFSLAPPIDEVKI